MSIKYKNNLLFYENEKFDLNQILNLLNYELEENNFLISKEDLINKYLDENYEDDKQFIEFINNDFLEPFMDIFTFIKENNLNIYINEIFKELWVSLKNKDEVLINNNLLKFMGFNINTNKNPKYNNYIYFLKNNNIDFELINYKNIKAQNYNEIQEYIKKNVYNDLYLKKWLILTKDNFKESLMLLNNKNSKDIKRYYLQLEKIFYLYNNYITEYDLKLKNKEINELKIKLNEKENLNKNIIDFINNNKIKNKNGYIYIATTKNHALLNIFYVGITTYINKNLFIYNSFNTIDNKFYYTFFEKVYNIIKIKTILNYSLKDFKDKKDENLFIIHYNYLKEIIILIIKNINEPYGYINNLINIKILNIYNLKPIIPKEIIINEEKIIYNYLKQEIVRPLDECIKLYNLNLTRKELLKNIDIENNNKNDFWNYIKKNIFKVF